jgi:hypothetical protein
MVSRASCQMCRLSSRCWFLALVHEANSVNLKTKAVNLAIKAAQINPAIIDIARRRISVGDDIKGTIDGAMIEIKEALWLAFTHQVTAVRIRR